MFYLKTLGELSLHASGPKGPPLLRNSKPLAVLAYLATAPGFSARRDHLAQLLWPESDAGHARSSLRQALHYISQRVGRPLVQASDTTVDLDASELDVDLWEFERALEAEDYAHAVELYAGPFVPGLERKAGAELEEWIESQDERLRAGLDVAYTRLVAGAMSRGWPSTAVEYGRLFVELNPLNEVAQLAYVRALKAAADQVGALRAYRSYRSLLREALHDVPSEELERAIASVRDEVLRDPTPDPDAAPILVPRRSVWRWVAVSGLVGAAGAAALVTAFFLLRPSDSTRDPFAGLHGTLNVIVGAESPVQLARVDYRGDDARLAMTSYSPSAVFSPDGALVAVETAGEGGHNLGLQDVETGEFRRLTAQGQDEAPMDWSPDGRLILFRQGVLLASASDYNWDLMTYELAAGRQHHLSDIRAKNVHSAAWSPRGVEIAMVADSGGSLDLFLMDANGGNVVRLTEDPADDSQPSWSPNGTRLAFSSERSGAADIYVINRDGSGLRRITRSAAYELSPCWLSDRVLAFVRRADGTTGDLWVVDLEQGEERRLTHRGDVHELARGCRPRRESPWVDRLAITPDVTVVSPGQYLRFDVDLADAAGRQLYPTAVAIDWSTSDSTVAAFIDPQLFQIADTGRVKITASAGGWRADTLDLLSADPFPGPTTLLLYEDWLRGIDPDRWIPWGSPLPFARSTGGPEGGGVFVSNGDSAYANGVVSRQAFAPGGGLTLEVWGQMPFDGRLYQDFALGFDTGDLPEEGQEWMALNPVVELRVQGPNAQSGDQAWLGFRDRRVSLPFPPRPQDWHLYALQLEPDGSVSLLIDGRFYWRTAVALDLDALPALNVVLGYRSFGVELSHGLVRVYYGPHYLLPEVTPEPARRPTFGY